MEICARVYRPRRPKESPLYLLVSRHVEELLRVWPERFERRHGPLRHVVERVLREFIKCGDLSHGFARCWCPVCRVSYLVPYSCRGRSFCPSCERKRSILWAEWLREEVIEHVPHRHVVAKIPRFLRRVFLKRRDPLLDLAQSIADAIAEHALRKLGDRARPGVVVSIATSGADGIYDPRLCNDRLLLGLKGTMSEFELTLLRQRSLEARNQKALRGELRTPLAIGFQWASDDRIEKVPDLRVQQALEMGFAKFRELGSARQTLFYMRTQQTSLPRWRSLRFGSEIEWILPGYSTIHNMLISPIYAGAYAYGRTRSRTEIVNERARVTQGHHKPIRDSRGH